VSEQPQPQSGEEKPENIYLVSTAGNPNFGDEYITAAWLRFLAKQRPDAEVWLDCPQPGNASFLFEGLHPRLKVTNMLWRVSWETIDLDPDEGDATVDRLVNELGTPLYDYGLVKARRATAVHLIGGGHITANWEHHGRLVRAARRLAEISGAQLFATGLGLMPPIYPEKLRDDLAAFDHATVRDQPSAEAVGVEMVCDDAFLDLPNLAGFGERTGPTATEKGEIWLDIQRDLATEETFDAAIEAVRAYLESPEAEGRTIRYLEAIPGGDRIAFDRLKDLIGEESFVPFLALWDGGFPARPRQTWITTRFHYHLLAAGCGAEGVAVEVNDDYYRTKHQSLIDQGTGWSVAAAGSPELPAPATNVEFRLTAGRLHKAKLEEAERLYPRKAPPRPAAATPAPEPARRPEPKRGGLFRR